jgi:putative FmdB family regulatory protein
MSVYEYMCPKCETELELRRSVSQRDDPVACPQCGSACRRVASVFATRIDYKTVVPAKDAFRKRSPAQK